MSELSVSLRLSWHVVVRNWVVYRKDFLAIFHRRWPIRR